MKTKTLILAIFSLLALANAGDREALRPSRAYADPNAQKPAYAYPGYQQPTAKRLAKRAAPVDYYYDVYMEPRRAYIEPAKAYTNPLRRLAKRAAPVEKINDDDDYDCGFLCGPRRLAKRDANAYAYPDYGYNVAAGLGGDEEQPAQAQKKISKGARSKFSFQEHDQERLAKREAPTYAYPNDYYVPAADPGNAPVAKMFERLAKRDAPQISDYYYEDVYGEPGRVAPVAKTNDDNDGPQSYIAYERLAKSFTPKINDYYYEDVYVEPGRVAPVLKTNNDNDEPKPYIAYERLAKRDTAAYAAKIKKKSKIAAVSVEDLNNPEYEDAPQQEAQARLADYEADDLLA